MRSHPQPSSSHIPRAHSPARWIVSRGDEGRPPASTFPTQHSQQGQPHTNNNTNFAGPSNPRRAGVGRGSSSRDLSDWQGAYGPTTRRRGKMVFVPAATKAGGKQPAEPRSDARVKGKGKEREGAREAAETSKAKGAQVRGLYESIVGASASASSSSTELERPRATPSHTQPRPAPAQPAPDLDLTLDSDGPSLHSDPDDDDDLVVLDELGLPEHSVSLRTRPRPSLPSLRSLNLLPTSNIPQKLPVQYALRESSFGFKFLTRQGWVPGQPLGVAPPITLDSSSDDSDEEMVVEGRYRDRRLVVPLRAELKFGRRGVGVNEEEERRHRREEKQEAERERKERGNKPGKMKESTKLRKRERRKQRADERERRELLAYMNR